MLPLPARALKVTTVVSRWFTLPAMPVPAFMRKALAVMSWSASLVELSGSASKMAPAVAVMLTWPRLSSMSPTVTLVAANRRAVAVAPVLKNTLVALCVMLPVPASTSMLPLPAAVLLVRMSAVPVNTMLLAASTLTLPLPLTMSALTVMSVSAPSAWIKMLPVPSALRAVSSPGAVPLFSVMAPAVVRSTICPLPPVVRMSLCTPSVLLPVAVLASLATRFTLRPTSSTIKASASST